MLDDGEIERRVRLIRPMEQHHASLKMMADSHWREAERDVFAAAWNAELAQLPEFAENTLHIVAGLLLPVWKRLPDESTRVYRTPDRPGRKDHRTASFVGLGRQCRRDRQGDPATPDEAHAALLEGAATLNLAEALQLRRSRVMGANRIELAGFAEAMRERLRAYGLFSEIISWKLRFFVPADANGVAVLGKLLETYPIERICEREAA